MPEEELRKTEEQDRSGDRNETVACTYNENGPTLQELLMEYIRKM